VAVIAAVTAVVIAADAAVVGVGCSGRKGDESVCAGIIYGGETLCSYFASKNSHGCFSAMMHLR